MMGSSYGHFVSLVWAYSAVTVAKRFSSGIASIWKGPPRLDMSSAANVPAKPKVAPAITLSRSALTRTTYRLPGVVLNVARDVSGISQSDVETVVVPDEMFFRKNPSCGRSQVRFPFTSIFGVRAANVKHDGGRLQVQPDHSGGSHDEK